MARHLPFLPFEQYLPHDLGAMLRLHGSGREIGSRTALCAMEMLAGVARSIARSSSARTALQSDSSIASSISESRLWTL